MMPIGGYYLHRGDPHGYNSINYFVDGRLVHTTIMYGSHVLQVVSFQSESPQEPDKATPPEADDG